MYNMSNFKKHNNSLSENKVYAIYKDNAPARVLAVEKRGRKIYLLLSWENQKAIQDKWVRDTLCVEHKPTGVGGIKKQALKVFPRFRIKKRTRLKLNWFQKLIIKLQDLYYGRRN